jgi:hypothetical protein
MLNISALKELYGHVKELKTNLGDLTDRGDLNLTEEQYNNITIQQSQENTYIVKRSDGSIIERLVSFAQVITAKLSVGLLTAKEGMFDTLALATDQLSIGGTSLRDYIRSVVESFPLHNSSEIRTPTLIANGIKAIISPLSADSEISLAFKNSSIEVRSNKGGTEHTVASIDADGNATFSGSLTAQDANIAGTLRAGKIVADQIEGLDDKLATLAAALQNQNESSPVIASSTDSATITFNSGVLSSMYQVASDAANENIASDIHDTNYLLHATDYTASVSSSLAYVPNFQTDFSTVTNGLMVYGSTSLAEVSVANQLSVGGSLILADNTINVLGGSLELQPLRQGDISFMGGLVRIDTDGNLSANGNAIFAKNVSIKGTLSANIISPVPGEDLIITLGKKTPDSFYNADSSSSNSKFVIKDSTGSDKFSVNSFGDIIASGAATLSSLQIVRGAQADTSVIETTASGSAGVASITTGYTSRTIYSPYVKADSLIYITPRSQTSTTVPYLSRQTADTPSTNTKGSFTVQIPVISTEDVIFNWWIVN